MPTLKRQRREPGPNAVVKPGKDPSWRSEGWAPTFDAASLVDYVADVVLAQTRDAIMRGESPAGGPQRPLDPEGQQGREAAHGRRPTARGYTGKRNSFPMKIRRAKMRKSPGYARVVIRPGVKHRFFVQQDADRYGVEYFSTDGTVAALIEEATKVWLKAALAGETPDVEEQERDADQVA